MFATIRRSTPVITFLDSVEGAWNTGRAESPNLGYKLRYKEGYFPCPPSDALNDLRSEMMLAMIECGLKVQAHHHEVASGVRARSTCATPRSSRWPTTC